MIKSDCPVWLSVQAWQTEASAWKRSDGVEAPPGERGGNGYTRTRKHHTSPLFSRRSVEHTAAKRPIDVSKVLV